MSQENAPRETVRKGVRVTSEASILVVSSNKIELLGLFSSGFEASGRSYQDFSDSLSRQLDNTHADTRLYGFWSRVRSASLPALLSQNSSIRNGSDTLVLVQILGHSEAYKIVCRGPRQRPYRKRSSLLKKPLLDRLWSQTRFKTPKTEEIATVCYRCGILNEPPPHLGWG